MPAFIQNISATQLIAILLIILLLFGAKRLPELARSFGKSLREFKNATKDIEKDFKSAMDDEPDSEDRAVPSRSKKVSPPKAEPIKPTEASVDVESSKTEEDTEKVPTEEVESGSTKS